MRPTHSGEDKLFTQFTKLNINLIWKQPVKTINSSSFSIHNMWLSNKMILDEKIKKIVSGYIIK